ncbi:MAG: caspase family protein, partial [Thermodesulfobacteriota bacterium]
MKLRWENRPQFFRGELGVLFGLAAAMAILFVHGDDAISSVLKMPKPLPDIIKSYKSVYVHAGRPGMNNTGVQVKQGDYITILAKGIIDITTGSTLRGAFAYGPKVLLSYKFSEGDVPRRYQGPEIIAVYPGFLANKESGNIYLSYGNYANSGPHTGFFVVDIIVWKTYDPNLAVKFLEEASSAQPKDKELKEIAQSFRERQEIQGGLQKAKKEVEEIEKELSKIESKSVEAKPGITSSKIGGVAELKKAPEREAYQEKRVIPAPAPEKPAPPAVQKPVEEKKVLTPPRETGIAGIKETEKEKKIEELTEKLQKALQAMKEFEEMKKKLTDREEKEAQLLARLESLEGERSRQGKDHPVIAVAYPRDGLTLDTEYVNLYGMAEHDKGITRFEILVNNKLVASKEPRDLLALSKDRRRIEFSEKIRLQEGQNTISIYVQGTGGLTSQKNISIQLAKKREKVFGVVIGINKYKNFPSLKYAVNDAREFYRYLTEVNQVPKDHVWLILDEEATLDKFRSTLGTLLRRSAGKDDTVIIFLAGHGATEQDPSSPDGDGLEKYILPYNADPKDLYASALPMSEVARIFQRISSERLVFIGDTCYSGASGGRTIFAGGTRANVSGAFLERLSQGKGRVIITASDANEVSAEKDE